MKSELLGKFSTFTRKLFKFSKNVALKQSPFFFFSVSLPLEASLIAELFMVPESPTAIATSLLPHTLEGRALDGVVGARSIREP